MENRGGGNPSVSGFGTDSFEAILQCMNERSARWSGVAGVYDPRRFVEIDFGDFNKVFNRLDECRSIGSVGEGCCVTLPCVFQHLSARINKLDTVILRLAPSAATRSNWLSQVRDILPQDCVKR